MKAISGKSKCPKYPFGLRRVNCFGDILAPRSLRRIRKKHYLKSCNDTQLASVGASRDVFVEEGEK